MVIDEKTRLSFEFDMENGYLDLRSVCTPQRQIEDFENLWWGMQTIVLNGVVFSNYIPVVYFAQGLTRVTYELAHGTRKTDFNEYSGPWALFFEADGDRVIVHDSIASRKQKATVPLQELRKLAVSNAIKVYAKVLELKPQLEHELEVLNWMTEYLTLR
jgi:hypothetical protein